MARQSTFTPNYAVRTVAAWAGHGARTLLLGGDHLMTLGALRAQARYHGPLGLVHFDAHPDAGHGEVWGTEAHHGTWVRQALEEVEIAGVTTGSFGFHQDVPKEPVTIIRVSVEE